MLSYRVVTKLKSSLFNSLHNSKYYYGRRTDSFKDGERSKVSGFRSQWDRLQLTQMQFRTRGLYTTKLECIQSGLSWRRFALSKRF